MANKNVIDFFREGGNVLQNDPTVQALCSAADKAFYDPKTGLFNLQKTNLNIYDFDSIADSIFAGDRSLLQDLVVYCKCIDNSNSTIVKDWISAHEVTSSRKTSLLSTVNGAVERGFSLDSSEPDYVEVAKDFPRNLSIDINKAFSIRVIFKYDPTATGCILSSLSASSDSGIIVYMTGGDLYVKFADTSIALHYWQRKISTFTSGFNELIITNDGTATSAGFNVYLNNVKNTALTTAGTVSSIANGNFIFGNDPASHYSAFNGIVDEISFWKAELTATQVSNIYNDGDFSTYNYNAVLDYLAWQFKIYLWDRSIDVDTKLNLLKQGLKLRGKLGTPWAVKQAIELVSDPDKSDFVTYPIVITEGTGGAFFDGTYSFDGTESFDSDFSVFKFDVAIPQRSTPTTTEQDLFIKAINSYKNARSWLETVTYPTFAFGGNPTLPIDCEFYGKLDDNAANTTTLDSTGIGDGVLNVNSSVIYSSSGIISSCYDFSIGNYYIDIDRLKSKIGEGKPFSVNFWFYGNGSTRSLFGNTNSSSTEGLGIFVSTGVLRAFAATSSGNWRRLDSSETLSTGWNMATFTFDGSTGPSNLLSGGKLYLNNVNNSSSAGAGTQTSWSPANVYAGRLLASYDNNRMDEIGAWDKELSVAEVNALYNSGAGLTY